MVEGKRLGPVYCSFKEVHSPLNYNKIPFVWNNSIQIIATLINVQTAFWDHLVVSHPSMLFVGACEKCLVKGVRWIKTGDTATLTGRPTLLPCQAHDSWIAWWSPIQVLFLGQLLACSKHPHLLFMGKEAGISNTSTHHPRLLGSIGKEGDSQFCRKAPQAATFPLLLHAASPMHALSSSAIVSI